jgi:hypothetical protein
MCMKLGLFILRKQHKLQLPQVNNLGYYKTRNFVIYTGHLELLG